MQRDGSAKQEGGRPRSAALNVHQLGTGSFTRLSGVVEPGDPFAQPAQARKQHDREESQNGK